MDVKKVAILTIGVAIGFISGLTIEKLYIQQEIQNQNKVHKTRVKEQKTEMDYLKDLVEIVDAKQKSHNGL